MNYVAASALLFAHPLFENILIRLLRMTRLCDTNGWLSKITKKSIPVSDLAAGSVDKALDRKLDMFFAEETKNGVLALINLLNSFLKVDVTRANIPGYAYSFDRIEQIDSLRHDFAHFRRKPYTPTQADDDILYMYRTAMHFLLLVMNCYGLKAQERPKPI